jgi:PAS domain S-box-containing protein
LNTNTISLLLIEDDKNLINEITFILKPLISKLVIAQTGQEGFDSYQKEKTDLIITALDIAILDGLTLSKKIKNDNPDAQIILLSNTTDSKLLLDAIDIGITNFITKPINMENIFEKIEKIALRIFEKKQQNEKFNLYKTYKKAVDLSAIVSKTDPLGKITYVNKEFELISGYKASELLGKPHSIIRHKDMESSDFQELWNTIKIKKTPWFGKVKNKRKDGTEYYVNTIINPILDKNHNVVEYIAIRSDITEVEKTKEYLKDQYNITAVKFEDVVRLSQNYEDAMNKSSIIIRISEDLKINFVNENFCTLTGYSADELISHPYASLLDENTSTFKINRIFKKAAKFGFWKGQLHGLTKQGKQIYFTSTIIPIKDKNNTVTEYMVLRNDITKITELHTELEETQREIIYTMGEIGEMRSKETGFHVKRVAEYSKLLALKAGLNEEEAELLKMASPMHDIGKVGIPDAILNKPGKLTEEEFGVMKEHASIGYAILKNSSRELLKTSALISHEHHERWDGSGYPRGLKGSEIHIFGRITAICDVFDALAHERPYKKAWKLEKILELFEQEKGKHFEPSLVNIFLKNLDEFLEIKNKYLDYNETKRDTL